MNIHVINQIFALRDITGKLVQLIKELNKVPIKLYHHHGMQLTAFGVGIQHQILT